MAGEGGCGQRPRCGGSGNALTHILVAVLGAGLAAGLRRAFGTRRRAVRCPEAARCPPRPPRLPPLRGSEQGILAKVRPSLVLISTPLQYDSEAAAGTGMEINPGGLVLTDNHVIEDSTTITATAVATGRTYQATVIGYDKTGDIALIWLRHASG